MFWPLELIPPTSSAGSSKVNVAGQLAVTQAFLPLLRQAQGRLVMIGPIGSLITMPCMDRARPPRPSSDERHRGILNTACQGGTANLMTRDCTAKRW